MKSKKLEVTILTDEDLITWDECVSYSYKQRTSAVFKKSADILMELFFRGVGLYYKGYQNVLDMQVRRLELEFPDLPDAFQGTRVLFMSDLHLGKIVELPDILLDKIKSLDIDLCLFGGDYRLSYACPRWPFIADLKRIVSHIRAPLGIYGVLGNHDGLELVPALENLGIKMLMNSSVSIEKGGQAIYLAGVDEIFAKRHDLKSAFSRIPQNAFCIFLGHSPDLYEEVEPYGARLYLCGHTHHGQIRLPVIGPVITNTSAPRKFAGGHWQYKDLVGYTGSGAGSGGPVVRFSCPPEICVITLKKTPSLSFEG